jgi:S-adenosylmethionine hydrolase
MPGIITLTTDFGAHGPFVGVMKAVILRHAPGATIIDLTHEVSNWWCAEAGFWLARAHRYFPAGTLHLAVVDPGVGSERRIIAAAHEEQLFLAPDNGILTMIPGLAQHARIHRLSEDWRARQGWPEPSRTFHGRDIFAPLAAALVAGHVQIEDIGPAITDPQRAALAEARGDGTTLRGQVVTIDSWGNLITNIDERLLHTFAEPLVAIGDRCLTLIETYSAASPGMLHALINSFGVLEIASNRGNAAELTGAKRGDVVTVRERSSG